MSRCRAALLLVLALAAPAGGAEPSLQARAARFPPLESARADFAQEREVSLVDEVLKATGRLSLTAPDRMRLELVAPERLTIVAQGSAVTVLDEHDQPIALPPEFAGFGDFGRALTTLLLGGRGPLAFDEKWQGPDRVALTPRDGKSPFTEIEMRFPPTSPLPETIVLRERGGDRTTIRLTAVQLQPAPRS